MKASRKEFTLENHKLTDKVRDPLQAVNSMKSGLYKTEKIQDIIQTEVIRAPIVDVFRAMTVARTVDEWGGGPARIQLRVDGKFSLWDGDMYGIIKEYDFPNRLVFTWREEKWEESIPDSIVRWDLEEVSRGTRLHLQHSGLSSRRIREIHNDGWGEYFLGPLKAYLELKKK